MQLHSNSNMTADNTFRNIDAIVYSEYCTVLIEPNVQYLGYLRAVLQIKGAKGFASIRVIEIKNVTGHIRKMCKEQTIHILLNPI